MKLTRKPKECLIFLLTTLLLLSLFTNSPISVFRNVIVCVSFTFIFDVLFLKIRKIKLFKLSAAIVTGLILSMLIPLGEPVQIYAAASLVAMFSKNFIRLKNFHIFNPAAFGIMVLSLVFGIFPSWWVITSKPIPLILGLAAIGFLVLASLKKWPVFISFYLTFLITFILLRINEIGLNAVRNALFDYTTIFFALVMLCEPMTSPKTFKNQIIYGAAVGLIAITTPQYMLGIFNEPLTFALLIGNIINFKVERG